MNFSQLWFINLLPPGGFSIKPLNNIIVCYGKSLWINSVYDLPLNHHNSFSFIIGGKWFMVIDKQILITLKTVCLSNNSEPKLI